MGYDMTIKAVDKESIEILSHTFNMTHEKLLNQCISGEFPVYFDGGDESAPETIKECAKQGGISVNALLKGLVNREYYLEMNTSKEIAYSSKRVFDDYFKERDIEILNGESVYVITEVIYKEMLAYLEGIFKTKTVYDAFVLSESSNMTAMLSVYNSMVHEPIDFNKYVLYFEHDW